MKPTLTYLTIVFPSSRTVEHCSSPDTKDISKTSVSSCHVSRKHKHTGPALKYKYHPLHTSTRACPLLPPHLLKVWKRFFLSSRYFFFPKCCAKKFPSFIYEVTRGLRARVCKSHVSDLHSGLKPNTKPPWAGLSVPLCCCLHLYLSPVWRSSICPRLKWGCSPVLSFLGRFTHVNREN